MEEELAFVKLRYKEADSDTSALAAYQIFRSTLKPFKEADDDFRLAAAVAGFGQLLRGTVNLGAWNYKDARALAANFDLADEYGYRAELVKLIDLADALADSHAASTSSASSKPD